MNEELELSIVMPCLNEAETLLTCIQKAKSFLERSGIRGEIIIADNGSTDGSQQIASEAGARIVQISQKGYGSALIGGIEAARGELIIMGDADDSYDFSNLDMFVEALLAGADLVMGNRFKGGIKRGAMPLLHRYVGNPILSWLGRVFFKNKVGDFHCGLRGFRRDAILSLNLQTTGMEFASEMVVKASINKLKIIEVPTILYPDGRSRPPHLRTWTDGWRHLRFLLMYSPRWLFFYPGIILIAFGALVSIWLLPGPRRIGTIILDINTLLYCSFLIILGLQTVLFYYYARAFGISTGLLPEVTGSRQNKKDLSLEQGLFSGFVLILVGFTISIGAIAYWGENQFGPLDPSISMRLAIPGMILFSAGIQIIFSSFFLGILSTKHK